MTGYKPIIINSIYTIYYLDNSMFTKQYAWGYTTNPHAAYGPFDSVQAAMDNYNQTLVKDINIVHVDFKTKKRICV